MKKKKINNLIILYLVIQPIIDSLTYLMIRYDANLPTISSIIRGLFFLFIIIYLYKTNNKKSIYLILGYFIIEGIYIISYTNNNIYTEFSSLLQIFYLPLVIYFFKYYDNLDIDDELIVRIYFIYTLLIIVPYLFHYGSYASTYYQDKSGFYGLFYGGNEISNILSILMPIVLLYTFNNKSIILKVVILLNTLVVTYLIGTKTIILSLLLSLGYIFIKRFITYYKKFKKRDIVILSFLLILLVILGIIVMPFTPLYKNINMAIKFYGVNKISDLFNIELFDDIIFSNRLSTLKDINNMFIKKDILVFLFGLGKTSILDIKLVEIDIFDIFYILGILGFIVYIYLIVKGLKDIKLKGIYRFSFYLGIIISLFAGHILTSTSVSIYLGVLIILNKNKNVKRKKKVIFISSTGGHLNELLQLEPLFKKYDYYLITERTKNNIALSKKHPMYYLVEGTYTTWKAKIIYPFRFLCNIILSIYYYNIIKPDCIVTTGSHNTVPMCYIAHILGKKIIFIETFANSKKPTKAGMIVYPISDYFIVQWKGTLKYYKHAIYGGWIF